MALTVSVTTLPFKLSVCFENLGPFFNQSFLISKAAVYDIKHFTLQNAGGAVTALHQSFSLVV